MSTTIDGPSAVTEAAASTIGVAEDDLATAECGECPRCEAPGDARGEAHRFTDRVLTDRVLTERVLTEPCPGTNAGLR